MESECGASSFVFVLILLLLKLGQDRFKVDIVKGAGGGHGSNEVRR